MQDHFRKGFEKTAIINWVGKKLAKGAWTIGKKLTMSNGKVSGGKLIGGTMVGLEGQNVAQKTMARRRTLGIPRVSHQGY